MARNALTTFIGVYLDEDLFEDFEDEFGAADAFVANNRDLASSMPAEIEKVLSDNPSEGELGEVLRDLGLQINTGGLTYREWLTKIAEHVRAAIPDPKTSYGRGAGTT